MLLVLPGHNQATTSIPGQSGWLCVLGCFNHTHHGQIVPAGQWQHVGTKLCPRWSCTLQPPQQQFRFFISHIAVCAVTNLINTGPVEEEMGGNFRYSWTGTDWINLLVLNSWLQLEMGENTSPVDTTQKTYTRHLILLFVFCNSTASSNTKPATSYPSKTATAVVKAPPLKWLAGFIIARKETNEMRTVLNKPNRIISCT